MYELDGLYVSNSALYMKLSALPLPSEAPYHIVRLDAEALLQAKCRVAASVGASAGDVCPEERVPGATAEGGGGEGVGGGGSSGQSYLEVLRTLTGQ